MLGDKIGETSGKVVGRRVLPGDDYRFVKMEMTIEEAGSYFGIQGMNAGTYVAFERVPGQMYGEGHGVIALSNGETAIWNGHGVGRMTGDGMALSFRYSIAVQAGAGTTLARLNEVLVVGEHDVDAAGNTRTTAYEWK